MCVYLCSDLTAAFLPPQNTHTLVFFRQVSVGFLFSNLIPFLADLMGLVASLASVTTTYTFPALFTVLILNKGEVPKWE